MAAPERGPVADDTEGLTRRPLGERMALRAIARVTGVSRSWLQAFVSALYRDDTPHDPGPLQKKSGRLGIGADELRSVGGEKGDAWRVWVAPGADPHRVVAVAAGDRSAYTARCPWEALPDEYRDGAVGCTDFLARYRAVAPEDRRAAAGKGPGLANHVERFWCPPRQRWARFVRKTPSPSKCPDNHTGALWYFTRLYNASLP